MIVTPSTAFELIKPSVKRLGETKLIIASWCINLPSSPINPKKKRKHYNPSFDIKRARKSLLIRTIYVMKRTPNGGYWQKTIDETNVVTVNKIKEAQHYKHFSISTNENLISYSILICPTLKL